MRKEGVWTEPDNLLHDALQVVVRKGDFPHGCSDCCDKLFGPLKAAHPVGETEVRTDNGDSN